MSSDIGDIYRDARAAAAIALLKRQTKLELMSRLFFGSTIETTAVLEQEVFEWGLLTTWVERYEIDGFALVQLTEMLELELLRFYAGGSPEVDTLLSNNTVLFGDNTATVASWDACSEPLSLYVGHYAMQLYLVQVLIALWIERRNALSSDNDISRRTVRSYAHYFQVTKRTVPGKLGK